MTRNHLSYIHMKSNQKMEKYIKKFKGQNG